MVALSLWWFYRAGHLPEPIATDIAKLSREGEAARWIREPADVGRIQSWFARVYLVGGLLGVTVALGWAVLALGQAWRRWMTTLLAGIMFIDMLWFAHDRSAQCDPSLYYPRVPLLEKLARATAGRIIGFECLPAILAQVAGLRDVRGADGVDPLHYVQLVMLAGEANMNMPYARIARLRPTIGYPNGDRVKLSPILDLLGVEYVVFRERVPETFKPAFVEHDYWALRNPSALPRAFVPRQVEHVPDDKERLAKLGSPDFDPRAVAYVETPVTLPEVARGRASIIAESSTEVTLSLVMETPGLVILTDRWDRGWRARLNGRSVPILRADHALRGIVVPEGSGILKLTYAPTSFSRGLVLFALAAATLAGLVVVEARRRRLARKA